MTNTQDMTDTRARYLAKLREYDITLVEHDEKTSTWTSEGNTFHVRLVNGDTFDADGLQVVDCRVDTVRETNGKSKLALIPSAEWFMNGVCAATMYYNPSAEEDVVVYVSPESDACELLRDFQENIMDATGDDRRIFDCAHSNYSITDIHYRTIRY